LVINSNTTLGLMQLWKKYEKMHFVVLPNKKDPINEIKDFYKMQDDKIKEVRNSLESEWHKDCVEKY
jgi:hypothetical protein